MDLIQTVFLLLLLVALSGVIVRFFPQLPLPVLQVGLGALTALPVTGVRLAFDPELFLLLFVSPLLFVDGWRVPKREFFQLRGPILTLALGLVLFTVIGAGYFVHGAIPAIPLSAAFALAAVLSPTDAVAVSAVAGRIKVPPRLMHVLEGEALLNDASGLVALKYAVAATLTGRFSPWEASGSFFLIALGGLAVGTAVAWLFGWVQDKLIGWRGEALSVQVVLLRLLLPFGVYLLAERLASGFRGPGGGRGGDDGGLHRPSSERRPGHPAAGARAAGHDRVCLQWAHFPFTRPAAAAVYRSSVARGV